MKAWIYVITAGILEIAWVYSVKFMQFKRLIKLSLAEVFTQKEGLHILLPVLGYIIFGVGNIVLFSKALKTLPAGIAYAVWMGIALAGVELVDVGVFKENISFIQVLFLLLILLGIIGLKLFS